MSKEKDEISLLKKLNEAHKEIESLDERLEKLAHTELKEKSGSQRLFTKNGYKTFLKSYGDWSEVVSKSGKGGKVYFYNKKTLVNQWKKPAEWIAKEEELNNLPSGPLGPSPTSPCQATTPIGPVISDQTKSLDFEPDDQNEISIIHDAFHGRLSSTKANYSNIDPKCSTKPAVTKAIGNDTQKNISYSLNSRRSPSKEKNKIRSKRSKSKSSSMSKQKRQTYENDSSTPIRHSMLGKEEGSIIVKTFFRKSQTKGSSQRQRSWSSSPLSSSRSRSSSRSEDLLLDLAEKQVKKLQSLLRSKESSIKRSKQSRTRRTSKSKRRRHTDKEDGLNRSSSESSRRRSSSPFTKDGKSSSRSRSRSRSRRRSESKKVKKLKRKLKKEKKKRRKEESTDDITKKEKKKQRKEESTEDITKKEKKKQRKGESTDDITKKEKKKQRKEESTEDITDPFNLEKFGDAMFTSAARCLSSAPTSVAREMPSVPNKTLLKSVRSSKDLPSPSSQTASEFQSFRSFPTSSKTPQNSSVLNATKSTLPSPKVSSQAKRDVSQSTFRVPSLSASVSQTRSLIVPLKQEVQVRGTEPLLKSTFNPLADLRHELKQEIDNDEQDGMEDSHIDVTAGKGSYFKPDRRRFHKPGYARCHICTSYYEDNDDDSKNQHLMNHTDQVFKVVVPKDIFFYDIEEVIGHYAKLGLDNGDLVEKIFQCNMVQYPPDLAAFTCGKCPEGQRWTDFCSVEDCKEHMRVKCSVGRRKDMDQYVIPWCRGCHSQYESTAQLYQHLQYNHQNYTIEGKVAVKSSCFPNKKIILDVYDSVRNKPMAQPSRAVKKEEVVDFNPLADMSKEYF